MAQIQKLGVTSVSSLGLALAVSAWATTSGKPPPVEPVHFSLRAVSSDMTPLVGVPFRFTRPDQTVFSGFTNDSGQTPFYELTGGEQINYALGEFPIDDGAALGSAGSLSVASVTGDEDVLSHVHSTDQVWAEPALLTGAEDGPEFVRTTLGFPHWEIGIPAGSNLSASVDVGVLVNSSVVDRLLRYYDSTLASDPYDRGLAIKIGQTSGVDFGAKGESGVVLSVQDYDSTLTYGGMSLQLYYFTESPSDAAATLEVHSVPSPVAYQASYSISGTLPEPGLLLLLWTADAVPPMTTPEVRVANPPDFPVATSGAQTAPVGCADCVPPKPAATPGWSCTPPELSIFQQIQLWLGTNCPGDGTRVGDPVCSQWVYALSPILCLDVAGTPSGRWEATGGIQVSVPIDGVGVGGEVSFSAETAYPMPIGSGAYNCGQCRRAWGKILFCVQKWQNQEPTYGAWIDGGNGHVYREKLDDCGRSVLLTTTCTDLTITSTVCDRK